MFGSPCNCATAATKCILNLSRICCVCGKSHRAHAILSRQLLAELFALYVEAVLHRGDWQPRAARVSA